MRIIDENGVEIVEHDPAKGYLVETEIIVKHHPAVAAVEEQGHYEVIAEYENGGKDVELIVDVAGVEAREAYDETETVLQFVPYTAEELAAIKIADLKRELQATDYVVLKIAEGAATFEEYAEIIAKRQEWRKEINDLEQIGGDTNGNGA